MHKNIFTKCRVKNDQETYSSLMLQSKYSLVYSERSITTVMLYDGIAALTIPILFRGKDFFQRGLPFQCIIPWDEIVAEIDRHAYSDNPARAISDAVRFLERNTSWVERALTLIQHHQPDLLWLHPESRL